jgi:hypothetical protein
MKATTDHPATAGELRASTGWKCAWLLPPIGLILGTILTIRGNKSGVPIMVLSCFSPAIWGLALTVLSIMYHSLDHLG